MASRDSLLDMLKNEYPSSYNSNDTDNMSVKELEDLLDFLDSTFKKKDGGLMVAIQKLAIGGNVKKKTAYDPRATTSDMANALRMSGGGSDAQKMQDLQRYNLNTTAPLQKGVMEQMLEKADVAPYTDNYNKPLGSLEEYMSGFEKYKAANPDKLARAGTMAMMPAILPGGYRYDFSGGAEASNFNDYLESIGQLPFKRYTDESMIKKLNMGGMTGGKTYHQYHDSFVPRDEESMGYANGGGVGSMMQPKKKKNKKAVVQGGVDNYLGKQPQVVAPRKWQSAPDKPATELAYITKAEKDLIIKKNIHGGLEGGPNMGPSGIMSLDSFGDVGGAGASGGDTSAGGGAMDGRGFSGRGPGQSERDFDRQKANQRAALQIAERAQANRLGYNERANIANRTYGPIQKYSGDGFLGGYRNVDPRTGQPLSGLAYAFDKFNPLSLIAGLVGGPIAGLFTRGITGLKNKFTDFKNADTLADLFPSLNKLNIGSKEFRDGFNIKDPNKINQVYDPNAPFTGTGRFTEFDKAKMGKIINVTNQKPPANITATNLNDLQIGNPGKYATTNTINEFGTSDDFNTSLINEFGTSDDFNTGLINEFGVKDRGTFDANEGLQFGDFPATTDDGFGLMNSDAAKAAAMAVMSNAFNENVMPGTSDMNYPDRNMDFPDTGMLVADASKNTNQQTLENIINKDMYEKNLQPAIDNQNKKNQIINNSDLLKDLGIIT